MTQDQPPGQQPEPFRPRPDRQISRPAEFGGPKDDDLVDGLDKFVQREEVEVGVTGPAGLGVTGHLKGRGAVRAGLVILTAGVIVIGFKVSNTAGFTVAIVMVVLIVAIILDARYPGPGGRRRPRR